MNFVSYITSILERALVAGTPLLLATVGEILTERSGIMNLGLEGLMAIGAVTSLGVILGTENLFLGVLTAIAVGGLMSTIHAFISINLRGRQILSGLAISMLGLGLSGLLGRRYVGIPLPVYFEPIKIPYLSRIPILGQAVFTQNAFFYISVALTIIIWYILFRTKWGITIRSVGENPLAADALGVNVTKVRYICTIIGGCLAGLAGAQLSLGYIHLWIEGMVGGRGWIAIALTIFSTWNPLRAFLGSYLFGGVYALQFQLQGIGISPNILLMLPYISTLVALLVTSGATSRKRIGAPSSLGEPFIKGEK